MILPTWFDHLRYVEDSFCYKEVQFEMFCPPVKPLALLLKTLGTFNKPQRQRRREHPQTKGLISRTMVLHMRFYGTPELSYDTFFYYIGWLCHYIE